MMKQKRQLKRK